jgi:hypothetical protein
VLALVALRAFLRHHVLLRNRRQNVEAWAAGLYNAAGLGGAYKRAVRLAARHLVGYTFCDRASSLKST